MRKSTTLVRVAMADLGKDGNNKVVGSLSSSTSTSNNDNSEHNLSTTGYHYVANIEKAHRQVAHFEKLYFIIGLCIRRGLITGLLIERRLITRLHILVKRGKVERDL